MLPTANLPLSMNEAGKWSVLSIFVGWILGVVSMVAFTIIWDRYHRLQRAANDVEAARDPVERFIAEHPMEPPAPEIGALDGDQELQEHPQHHNDGDLGLLHLDLPEPLGMPIEYLWGA